MGTGIRDAASPDFIDFLFCPETYVASVALIWRSVKSAFAGPGRKDPQKNVARPQVPTRAVGIPSAQPSESMTFSAALIEETVVEEVVVARRKTRRVLAAFKKHN